MSTNYPADVARYLNCPIKDKHGDLEDGNGEIGICRECGDEVDEIECPECFYNFGSPCCGEDVRYR